MGNGNLDLEAVDVDFGLFDPVHPPDAFNVQVGQVLPSHQEVGGTDGSLHDAAGGAEDGSGSGVLAHQLVGLPFGEVLEVDPRFFDHPDKFPGRQNVVHVLETGISHLRPSRLKLLGGAGHDGDADDLAGVDGVLLSEVGLHQGSEHLLRRLAGGDELRHVGEVGLHKLDPPGRAGGDQGERPTGLDPSHQFRPLFHDGQVGAEVGVEDIVEADLFQGGVHLPYRHVPGFHAELLGKADPDGRSLLDNHDLLGIENGVPNLFDFADLPEGAGGTEGCTLAAVHAGAVTETLPEEGVNVNLDASVDKVDGVDGLDIVTNRDTTSAGDTLFRISRHGNACLIELFIADDFGEAVHIHAHVVGQVLKFTLAVGGAGGALNIMVGEDQLDQGLSILTKLFTLGLDDDPF